MVEAFLKILQDLTSMNSIVTTKRALSPALCSPCELLVQQDSSSSEPRGLEKDEGTDDGDNGDDANTLHCRLCQMFRDCLPLPANSNHIAVLPSSGPTSQIATTRRVMKVAPLSSMYVITILRSLLTSQNICALF
jgi:hypothetical protein